MTLHLSPSDPFARQITGTSTRSKYGARKTSVDGIRFDSGHELRAWRWLITRQALGEIRSVRRQVRYRLMVKGALVCVYVADFVYVETGSNVVVIADAKSKVTARLRPFRIKAKLFAAITGRQILEL